MISVFDLFKIGIGPSSSHAVGPMRAAKMFATPRRDDGLLHKVSGIEAELFGSLGTTGHGHGSVPAVVPGLTGEDPETVDPAAARHVVDEIRRSGTLPLAGRDSPRQIPFNVDDDIILHRRKRLPFHPNAMVFRAEAANGAELATRYYYLVGGGFVLSEDEAGQPKLVPDTSAACRASSTANRA